MIRTIDPADAWAAEAIPDLHGSDDAHLFLERRRQVRIRPDAPGLVAAVHRDGRRYLLEMQHDEIAGLTSEKFALQLFDIADRYAKATARGTTSRGGSIFKRLGRAARNLIRAPREQRCAKE